ncbi:MAG: RHS repeat-associated core domain-containing protein [Bacteroidia bacterium]
MDEETGFYYYGARYYNPQTSVWLSVDPLADKYPNMSPYIYTANNPVNYIDPDGRKITDPIDRLNKMLANAKLQSAIAESFEGSHLSYGVQEQGWYFNKDFIKIDPRTGSPFSDSDLKNASVPIDKKISLKDKLGYFHTHPSTENTPTAFSPNDIKILGDLIKEGAKEGFTMLIQTEQDITYALVVTDKKAAKKFFKNNDVFKEYNKQYNSRAKGDELTKTTENAVLSAIGEGSGVEFFKGTKDAEGKVQFKKVTKNE